MSNLTSKKSGQDQGLITWPPPVLIVNPDFSEFTDRELFETIQNGTRAEQHQAFNEFYSRYAQTLALLLAKLLDEPYGSDAAKEIFSEVWEVMWENIPEFSWEKEAKTRRPERSYLLTTGRNKVFDRNRYSSKQVSFDLICENLRSRLDPNFEGTNETDAAQVTHRITETPHISELNFPEQLEIRIVANKLLVQTAMFLKKLNELSTEDHKILELRCFFNRSYAEIGEQLGKSESAVRTKFCRIAQQLRSRLGVDI